MIQISYELKKTPRSFIKNLNYPFRSPAPPPKHNLSYELCIIIENDEKPDIRV